MWATEQHFADMFYDLYISERILEINEVNSELMINRLLMVHGSRLKARARPPHHETGAMGREPLSSSHRLSH